MQTQIAFLTLFLGLVSGEQRVEMQAGPGVKTVRVMAGDDVLATIEGPPWRAIVNFGPELAPRRLSAVAYDASGTEVGRGEQILNLPRQPAEAEILLRYAPDGQPVGVELRGHHIQNQGVRTATLALDGVPLELDPQRTQKLPQLDLSRPHVLSAEIRFADAVLARREVVFGGAWSAMEPAELTPVLVRQSAATPPTRVESCFMSGGKPVRTATIEMPRGIVVIVRGVDSVESLRALDPAAASNLRGPGRNPMQHLASLDSNVDAQMIWPSTKRYATAGQPTAELFGHTSEYDSAQAGVPWLLTRIIGDPTLLGGERRWADAAAVAAVTSMTGARRRAVVLVLGRDASDRSRNRPEVVRRYLAATGTPFFVWSLSGPRPDLEAQWGPIEDISSRKRLVAAIARLNREIASQRIAWVQADVLEALDLVPTKDCGYTPAAAW